MKKTKVFRLFTTAFILCLILGATPAFANYDIPVNISIQANEDASDLQIMAEVTEWYYRNNNGILEKRLWSVTYGRWLTDWMPA